jgi:LPXTG-site transpeptidase (sortase) family protein
VRGTGLISSRIRQPGVVLFGACIGVAIYGLVLGLLWLPSGSPLRAPNNQDVSKTTRFENSRDDGVKVQPNVRVAVRKPMSKNTRLPGKPIAIEIPAIGVDARVVNLGLNPDGTLEVPDEFSDTGWYRRSAEPGLNGPAVIVGHVDSFTGPAVFSGLEQLRSGDLIRVTNSEGVFFVYQVQRGEWHEKNKFPTQGVYGATIGSTLRLITCGGDFDEQERRYLQNYIVFASLSRVVA